MSNKPKKKRKLFNPRTFIFVSMFIIYIAVFCYSAYQDCQPINGDISYNEMMEILASDRVDTVEVTKSSETIKLNLKDGTSYVAINPKSDTFIEDILKLGVNVKVQQNSALESALTLIGTLPILVVMALISLYIVNFMIGSNIKQFTLLKHIDNNVTFDSIRGLSEVKKEVEFIIRQIKNWRELDKADARLCKGALLYGPPGCGKTLIAKAIAKEAKVNFISCSGADFNEMFVGVGAARVKKLWELAETNTPCVIFIDEIDCLGRRRKNNLDSASNDASQTLNCLLQKMDGINVTRGIMVIAATNRKEVLDEALLRPGRFDRQYYIGPPDNKKDRDEIVDIYLQNKKKSEDVTLDKVSKLLVGFTGAEIENVLNESVYNSILDDRDGIISLADIDKAIMRHYTAGVPKEHTSEMDKRISAYHEAGHTVVSILNDIPISVVSINRYSSGAGGVSRKDLDKYEENKFKFESDFRKDIQIYLAGKVTEEIIFGQHTQGCSNDIQQASSLVYQMVDELAFDDNIILNNKMLIEAGLLNSLEDSVIEKCNNILKEINEDTRKLVTDNLSIIHNMANDLIKNNTIVMPTLEMFKD